METSVAKGMAPNPEVRNPKWGRGSGWAQGQVICFFSKVHFSETMAASFAICIFPQPRHSPEFKNFRKLEPLSGSGPSSLVLQGESQ